jgi:hypothetical protein
LGGALNRAKEAVQSGNSGASGQQTTTAQPAAAVPAAVGSQNLTAEQRTAIAKLTDESKRTAKKSEMLSGDFRISDWYGTSMLGPGFRERTVEEIQAIKAEIEPRHAENVEIYCTLWEIEGDCTTFIENHDFGSVVQPSMKPSVREALNNSTLASDVLFRELDRYGAIMSRAKATVRANAKINIDGDLASGSAKTTVEEIVAGRYTVWYFDEQPHFVIFDEGGKPVITPASEQAYNDTRNELINAMWMLNKAGSPTQYHEYWVADIARGTMAIAQRNSRAKEVKQPVPAAQMNDAALTARMLKMAQDAYPTWGIVRLIIDESAWRPETNALGQIIHRRINTKIILPRSSGGYIMRTLSFIEPYAGGSSYGEARPFGIGTDEVAVDYK